MSDTATEAIDATAIELETSTELVHAPAPGTLFRTDDPVEVLERASEVAKALKSVIDKQGLVTNIQGRQHVRVEGWTTLGSMLGVVPVTVWTRKVEDGWEARVEARTMDGRVVGAAEAMCSASEKTWKTRDDYALRSMAQTRATSKALRGPLGFVVTLAGYEATPEEEMPAGGAQVAEASPELKGAARNVVSFLMDGNQAATTEALSALATHFKAHLPADAGQAIVLVGAAVKRYRENGPPERASDLGEAKAGA